MAAEQTPCGGEDSLARREALGILAAIGAGTLTFQRALSAAVAQERRVTAAMVRDAEWIAGIELSEEDRARVANGLARQLRAFESMRAIPLDNSVPPALHFDCAPGAPAGEMPERRPARDGAMTESAAPQRPGSDEDLAFLPVTELAALLRTRRVSSVELTRLYLERLRRYDPALLCVVTLTEETAMRQAERADREIASGRYRGPLHGIPWGAKDLIAYPGYPTTWGAPPYRSQVIETRATVAQRLDDAGAVLVAKLSLGALAMGDRWFRGMTRNPWNREQGSSGSSAGPAASTAAGLAGFTLGSETLGSIVSPCTRCGATGLRPTFGRVSRHGCMALSWSMDKIGPIARSVEDCALVLRAIAGPDGLDPTVRAAPFDWPVRRGRRTFTVGYFEEMEDSDEVGVLRDLGMELRPVRLPEGYPADALRVILDVEATAAFDELTRAGITEGLNYWPRIFQRGEFVPAVEYIRANRIRTLLMRAMGGLFEGIDAYIDTARRDLVITNLTGHPTVVLPGPLAAGRDGVETPTSVTFTGTLFGEAKLLAVAMAYQQATGHHLRRPPMERLDGPSSR